MNEMHVGRIAVELSIGPEQVSAVARLLEEGATIPFIARYRKEATQSLDEVAITAIRDRLEKLSDLDSRREAIFRSLEERGLLTEELKAKIDGAETMTVLEDIYLPFRPKRRTRATIAREKGLEPLAQRLFAQDGIDPVNQDPFGEALAFVDGEKGVDSVEEALSGARDIIAEWISEDATARGNMRDFLLRKARFRSKVIAGKEKEGIKYRDYFEWEEPVHTAPSHRILAMRRGEKEEVLTLRVLPPEQEAIAILESIFIKGSGPASDQVRQALEDGYQRLLLPSMETEIRVHTKKRADEEAIRVFAENLRQLILAPPLGQKNVLAIDPGFRTGCKVVCLDRQGKLLHTDTIFPHQSEKEADEAAKTVMERCDRFEVEAIAVGNGTAGRETETFVKRLGLPMHISVMMVNESGASVYSASDVAREEFPDHDVTVRGSVSIGRRLMDPLAELVKIDPKSIGVGQYQHDVDQPALKRGLDDVVMSCVNAVGVEVNTASKELLTYVSGLGPQLAKAMIKYRNEHGPFGSREELKKVPRLGPKAFEQAAGFLRIRGAKNPLDGSAVHPESYFIVEAMARDLSCSVSDLIKDEDLRKKIDSKNYLTESVGLPTLNDILNELAKPGRDPRESFETFAFTEGVDKMEDLKPGMRLPGIVTNITAFGAFVDIGVHQDGLIHVSELSNRFVKNPSEVVKVHQRVMVTVLNVEIERKRISLSMRSGPSQTVQTHEASAGVTREKKGERREPVRKGMAQKQLFNNPFADALKDR
ncbi:MAG: RNA-binding transcriptional accessory protein [Deltaproteobacteria bacterium]|nr:RNA-binding transcriptional accessory protein [Deltaproteobacteria bacterium]